MSLDSRDGAVSMKVSRKNSSSLIPVSAQPDSDDETIGGRRNSVPNKTQNQHPNRPGSIVGELKSSAELETMNWNKNLEKLALAGRTATATALNRKTQSQVNTLIQTNARIDEILDEINAPVHQLEHDDIRQLDQPHKKGRTSKRPSISVTDWRPFASKRDVVSGSVEVIHPASLKRSETMRDVKIRSNEFSARIGKFLNHPIWVAASILLTFYSLFIHDIMICSFPAAADSGINGSLLFIFILFSIEIILNCLIKQYYIFGFYFWLDLIGTFSLLFDIPMIYDSMFDQSGSQRGVSGQMSRTTSALQITRLARLFHVLRVIRVVRIFKFHQSINVLVNNSQNPNKVGLYLSELIDKRVVFMVFCMLIILPFLSPQTDDISISVELGLRALSLASIPQTRDNLARSFIQFHSNCIYLLSGGISYVDQRSQNSELRSTELDSYSFGSTVAIFSVRDEQYQASLNSILLTILIIFIFLIGSVVVSRDVHLLVVAPLERMQVIIRRLAGTVCFLSAASEADEHEMAEGFETNMIEAIIEKMAHIFSVQPEADASQPKPVQMMAGSKLTEIQTASSIVSIEVVERPRILDMDETEIQRAIKDDGINSIHVPIDQAAILNPLNPSNYVDPNPAVHKELTSIESILSFPPIVPHFKLYLQSNLLVENLLFYQEVERFRSIMIHHATNIHSAFLSDRAINPVAIAANSLENVCDDLNDPALNTFDAAERETIGLMSGHIQPFLQSKFCQAYLVQRSKNQDWKKSAKKDKEKQAAEKESRETPGNGVLMQNDKTRRDSVQAASKAIPTIASEPAILSANQSNSGRADQITTPEHGSIELASLNIPGAVNSDE